MNKKVLVHNGHSNLMHIALEGLFREHFEVIPLSKIEEYPKKDCALWIEFSLVDQEWYKPYIADGYKLIIDHFWDSYVEEPSITESNSLTLRAKNFVWWNFAIWWLDHYRDVEFDFTKNADHFFLMLLRKDRRHRTNLYEIMTPFLDSSLYSYMERGVSIQEDVGTDPVIDVNGKWYQHTHFSLVSETWVVQHEQYPTFISEKTFKPIAWQHPFITFGVPNTLTYLHESGFETFGHIIDESYDKIIDVTLRLQKIFEIVSELYKDYLSGKNLFSDHVTKEKLIHNYYHFYNKELLHKMFYDEVVTVLNEFLET
ncbi:hypothetical protein UFOVP257_418 [uncultured Caudovirales phage]|uniref:Uncharacterized protein n=1 Tax=uncultured Caudovirales phage TaxID=2100421 RepID=A0A6J5LKQ5_9CAUD|nr:hypothetical protein UFOVP257_418 [uncultured Caudovirales phage]